MRAGRKERRVTSGAGDWSNTFSQGSRPGADVRWRAAAAAGAHAGPHAAIARQASRYVWSTSVSSPRRARAAARVGHTCKAWHKVQPTMRRGQQAGRWRRQAVISSISSTSAHQGCTPAQTSAVAHALDKLELLRQLARVLSCHVKVARPRAGQQLDQQRGRLLARHGLACRRLQQQRRRRWDRGGVGRQRQEAAAGGGGGSWAAATSRSRGCPAYCGLRSGRGLSLLPTAGPRRRTCCLAPRAVASRHSCRHAVCDL